MFKDDLFAGRRVLVTGGGTGLGRMMAERLLSLGAAVEIWGRRPSVVEEAAAAMNAARPGMALWRERLFALLHRNAAPASGFFRIPGNRIVELGTHVEI